MKWYGVCQVEDVPVKGARTINVQGKDMEVGLFRTSGGQLLAVANRCPHKEGPLAEGIVSGSFVICPLHNWKINLEDGKVEPPDEGCVDTYDVKIKDGLILIALP